MSSRSSGLDERTTRRARWAVSALFLLNGVSMAALVPRYPELVDAIGLSNAAFGLAVGLGPVGGLLAGLAAARIMGRFGSGPTGVVAQLLATVCQSLVYIAGSWWWLVAALMLALAADAITDVAQNSHGMRVERRMGRSVMNSFHAFWSLGAVLGGMLGAVCAQLGMTLWAQGLLMIALVGIALVAVFRNVLTGSDQTERTGAIAPSSPSGTSDADVPTMTGELLAVGRTVGGMPVRSLFLLGALGMLLILAGATEDAGATWGALYMRAAHDALPLMAGMAFVALQGAQMLGRFTGDAITDRLGDRRTARLGALIGLVGMTLGLLLPGQVTSILGFAAAGWGVATLFPAAFRAADDMPGLAPGVGMTVVGWVARFGFFLAPPLVGVVADALSLERALWLMPLYALGILAVSGALQARRPTEAAH